MKDRRASREENEQIKAEAMAVAASFLRTLDKPSIRAANKASAALRTALGGKETKAYRDALAALRLRQR
jgi:hypothetical protein